MKGVFQFKQFSVDQTGCAMKINTDGVLLGALTVAYEPKNILDIGTGTGVIALMLAQRFISAKIDAAEIDAIAAQTAGRNFENSPFASRLSVFPLGFEQYFQTHPEKKYDLIVSNPPFYLNSLTSPKEKKTLAKHTDDDFFEQLVTDVARQLSEDGLCWLVLPLQAGELVKNIAGDIGLHLQRKIDIQSFEMSEPHRVILAFGKMNKELIQGRFVIYKEPKVYSEMYVNSLKDFFTIF